MGQYGTRWTLATLASACDWLRLSTAGGLSRLLDRLGISWKRGKAHIHSPDPDYAAKVALALALRARAAASAGREVFLYLDEFSYYRQPTVAHAWEERGHQQPLAERSTRSNTVTRVVGTLDASDGRVLFRQGKVIGVRELVGFYQQVREAYPQAQRIWVAQDNWPVHRHPDVLVALEDQQPPHWPRYLPPNWPTEPSAGAVKRWGELNLPIQVLLLPTYAPETNCIEKLWRWLNQEVLHLHRLADALDTLRKKVGAFLDGFATGSLDLLRYVGLR